MNFINSNLKRFIRKLKPTFLAQILQELEHNGFSLKNLHALEVFGAGGQHHTSDIYKFVKNIEIWEYDGSNEVLLKKHFPKATIKITDSFKEIDQVNETFDLVVVDNPTLCKNNHYEHFDLFPSIFRVFSKDSIVIINIMLNVMKMSNKRFEARKKFYNCEDPHNLSYIEVEDTYDKIAKLYGFKFEKLLYKSRVPWNNLKKRDTVLYGVYRFRKNDNETVL